MRAAPTAALVDLAIVAGVALLTWAATALLNRPLEAPDWQRPLAGLSFSPFWEDQSPLAGVFPSPAQIEADVVLLKGRVRSLRTYSAEASLADVPGIAARHGLSVALGAWIGEDRARNRREIDAVARLSWLHGNVERVIAGNETMLRGDVALERLVADIRRLRTAARAPVSTSEPWHVWLEYPELADEVDFIAAHVLPYWEGLPLDESVAYIFQRYDELRAAFPGKEVVLTEVGWPSDGRQRGAAVPSRANQGAFLRAFAREAARRGVDYYVIEAFDQPWKMSFEGAIGAYWGLHDAGRRPKFPASGPLVDQPRWPWLTLDAVALGALPALLLLRRMRHLRPAGRLFLALLVQAAAAALIWAWQLHDSRYLTHVNIWLLGATVPAFLLLLTITLTEGLELCECLWTRDLRRRFQPRHGRGATAWPTVSIHLPICNEPPEMVLRTLQDLSRLDYPDFEVVVVDNNTADPALWGPVAEACRALGPRFRFHHLGDWPGYKAGALNRALRLTRPDAEIVALIDSDYRVERDWLTRLVPLFEDPEIALVQAPQDYRDNDGSAFKDFCFWEYAGFFHLGMVQRNERDAIIQHGTMVLLRRQAVEEAGGWAEWCICEDAELGFRLAARGYQSAYVPQSYGRGLLPDSFAAYKQQRFRWAYGAMQILKRHWRALLPWADGPLGFGQKYHYFAGWLPWIADGLHLAVTFLVLFWTVGLLAFPATFDYPLNLFTGALLAFLLFKLVKLLWLYTARIGCGFGSSLGAALAGLGLSHSVARAVWCSLVTAEQPFRRTPKHEARPPLSAALAAVREEAGLLAVLWLAAAAILVARGAAEPAAHFWALLLTAQSLPYLAAIAMALLNALPRMGRRQRMRPPVEEVG